MHLSLTRIGRSDAQRPGAFIVGVNEVRRNFRDLHRTRLRDGEPDRPRLPDLHRTAVIDEHRLRALALHVLPGNDHGNFHRQHTHRRRQQHCQHSAFSFHNDSSFVSLDFESLILPFTYYNRIPLRKLRPAGNILPIIQGKPARFVQFHGFQKICPLHS